MTVLDWIKSTYRMITGRIRSFFIYRLLYYTRISSLKSIFEPSIFSWSLVFDIGGHLGDKTRYFSHYPHLKIITIEPHPYYFEKLSSYFSNNPAITLLHAGIADHNGTSRFYPSSSHPSVSTFNRDMIDSISNVSGWTGVTWEKPIEIKLLSLQSLIDSFGLPDFVKIDVEGNEDKVLSSLQEPLPFLSFEYLPAYRQPAMNSVRILENLGNYLFVFFPKESYDENQEWVSSTEIRQFITSYTGPSGNIFAKRTDSMVVTDSQR